MAQSALPRVVPRAELSAWAPLREPLFRSLWTAAVISYTGTWMQNVGSGWLMTQLTSSPFMVSLVQAASTIPVFLVILPAGALADLVDRRRFLLITQSWMVAAAAALALLTYKGMVTPCILLFLTFLLGLGAVMNDPAWQAITPEVISPQQHASAVTLNSVGFNVARAAGPAIGGAVIATAGSPAAFMLNAISFFGVIGFLYHWKRPEQVLPTGSMKQALLSGFAYVRSAPIARCVLVRTATFSLGASAMLALLPVIARPHGATGYGLLLGCFGLGALAGAAVLPQLRLHLSVDALVGLAILVFAAATLLAGHDGSFPWLLAILFTSGAAWIGILACLNVAAQTMSPPYLRARALSMYILVLQGGMALGSAAWGALASWLGISVALSWSAIALVAGLLAVKRYPLSADQLHLAPAVVRD